MAKFSGDAAEWQEAVGSLSMGETDPSALMTRCLSRISTTDPTLKAWRTVFVDDAEAIAAHRTAQLASGEIAGALHGVPVGIKDIIDVAGAQTLCNSAARAGIGEATADAGIVRALRRAGAIILGKTHTTEFACFDPAPTTNPHNVAYTPGGSSSGSAASVAAGQVPLSVGTQTVASVNRPAAYCGLNAFKATPGLWPMDGVVPFAPSFDTPGLFASSLDGVVHASRALGVADFSSRSAPMELHRVVVPEDALLTDLDDAGQTAFVASLRVLSDMGYAIEHRALPVNFAEINAHHGLAVAYEAARSHWTLYEKQGDQLGPKLSEVIERGRGASDDAYFEAMRAIDHARRMVYGAVPDDVVFVWPATPTPAPKGLEWTGDPRFIQPWTALSGPTLSLPQPCAAGALPRGVVCAARPFADDALLRWGQAVGPAILKN